MTRVRDWTPKIRNSRVSKRAELAAAAAQVKRRDQENSGGWRRGSLGLKIRSAAPRGTRCSSDRPFAGRPISARSMAEPYGKRSCEKPGDFWSFLRLSQQTVVLHGSSCSASLPATATNPVIGAAWANARLCEPHSTSITKRNATANNAWIFLKGASRRFEDIRFKYVVYQFTVSLYKHRLPLRNLANP